jgi:hypothetical protein
MEDTKMKQIKVRISKGANDKYFVCIVRRNGEKFGSVACGMFDDMASAEYCAQTIESELCIKRVGQDYTGL